MQIQILNKALPIIPLLLLGVELDILKNEKQICSRRRFLKKFNPLIAELTKKRIAIQEQFAIKNDGGLIKVEGEKVFFAPDDMEKVQTLWNQLNDQFSILEVPESDSRDLENVRQILIDEQKRFIISKGKDYNKNDEQHSALIEEAVVSLTPKQ